MILPTTYISTLLLIAFSMLCWGSWANTQKIARKLRFELYYFDFAIGVLLASLIAAFTFGSIDGGYVETDMLLLSVWDNLSIARKLNLFQALIGGVLLNLATMLLVAAISVAGMAVALPLGIGLAAVAYVVWNFVMHPAGNPALVFGAVAVIAAAIVAALLAYRSREHSMALAEAAASAEAPKPAGKGAGSKMRGTPIAAPPKTEVAKGAGLALSGGVLMGMAYPLFEMSKRSEIGVGPYLLGFVLGVAVFLSTPVFGLVFMNLTVRGEPIGFRSYFDGGFRRHLPGFFGGSLWSAGAIALFVASRAPRTAGIGPSVCYELAYAAPILGILWGILVWKEFAGARGGAKGLAWLTLLLYTAGVAMLTAGPLLQ